MWNQKGGKNEEWEWDIVNVNCTVNCPQSFLDRRLQMKCKMQEGRSIRNCEKLTLLNELFLFFYGKNQITTYYQTERISVLHHLASDIENACILINLSFTVHWNTIAPLPLQQFSDVGEVLIFSHFAVEDIEGERGQVPSKRLTMSQGNLEHKGQSLPIILILQSSASRGQI